MKILKEAADTNGSKTFNPFKDVKWMEVLKDSGDESLGEGVATESLEEALFAEALDNPFNIKGPELNQTGRDSYGTCFKRTGHPSIYGVIGFDEETGEVTFQALDHEFGNHWRTSLETLTGYFEDGTFHEATEEDIKRAYEYED